MVKRLKKWIMKYVDYTIVGEYYDTADGIHYRKKYIKKYYIKKKLRRNKNGKRH